LTVDCETCSCDATHSERPQQNKDARLPFGVLSGGRKQLKEMMRNKEYIYMHGEH
jgi:hypothetical protein